MTHCIDDTIKKNWKHLPLDRNFFPFPVQLNLKPFIDQWLKPTSKNGLDPLGGSRLKIKQLIKEHPFLLEPIEDVEHLAAHQDLLDLIFSPILPPNGWSNSLQAVSIPFYHHKIITATDAYYKLIESKKGQFDIQNLSIAKERVEIRILYGYKFILKKFYNLDIKIDNPVISTYTDQETGLTRYFKLNGNMNFLDVENLGPLPSINKHTLQKLMERQFDPVEWAKHLPPELFLFSGMSLISLIDITIEEAAARLQYSLLHIHDNNRLNLLDNLTQEMRNLFRLPQLRLGIATLQLDGKLNYSSEKHLWNSLLLRNTLGIMSKDKSASIYEEIIRTQQTHIVEDLENLASDKTIHSMLALGYRNIFLNAKGGNCADTQAILDKGYRNILITPLQFEDKTVGLLELSSPNAGDINGLALLKINQLKPIFVDALRRHLQTFENKVEAVMLERYTAIHPAIHWRFRESAIQLLNGKGYNKPNDDIVFDNVYPFYGSLDIRDSSAKRNRAIISDLLENLKFAHDLFQQYSRALSLDILGELLHSVEEKMQRLETSFSAGDETSLAGFIRKQINPVVAHLSECYPKVAPSARKYLELVNVESNIFTHNRLAYEEALQVLNQTMSACIDEEEQELQKLFPCYFEKYQTDGIEYNIYMGASISPNHTFNPIYLNNLRLRQLLWTCKIISKVNDLQPLFATLMADATAYKTDAKKDEKVTMATMQIAPLILAYNTPLTLKFRLDEKHLDVDGAYNVRYEIIKKRIDKALIKGTHERLTQPGHIAIVYADKQEATAYLSHLEYLATQQHVQPGWEELELEDMQGVDGLKAIRVKV